MNNVTTEKTSIDTSSSSANARKYYEQGMDFTKSSSPHFDWLNKKDLMKDYWNKPGFFQFGGTPQIRFNRKGHRGPILDATLNSHLGGWLISDRLKLLYQKVDPEAFAFCKVDVDFSNFPDPSPDFWFAQMVRELDCVDEANSKINFQEGIEWKNYLALLEVKIRPELVGNAHAFRLQYAVHTEIVDDVILDAIQSEKISGFEFRPLQK